MLFPVLAAPACARPASLDGAPPGTAPRPLVLLVHGRGHGGLDTASVRRSWRDALNAGTKAVAGRTLLGDDDVALVWYADALDPLSGDRCTTEQLARYDRRADDGFGAVLSIAGGFLAALTVDGAGGDDARELRNIAGDLQFFGDPARRCASERRLDVALRDAARAGRPVILVAHSMGAIVSWSYLRGVPAAGGTTPPIRRLVTVGSPVGSPGIRQLLLGGDGGPLALPAPVRSWINVVDANDPFAVPLGGSQAGMRDVRTRTAAGEDPHHIMRYLRDPATIDAVIGGWCEAFGSARPRGCDAVGAAGR